MTPAPRPPALVWLVEDEPHYRSVFGFLIGRAAGVALGAAFADAEEALVAARTTRPDARPSLVVVDVNLPGLDGVAALGPLAAALPDARFVMLTGRDDPETVYRALRAGAQGYLLKDAPAETLLDGLRQALGGAMLAPAPVARLILDHFREAPPRADYGLSTREREVLRLVTEGLTQKAIAAALFISPSTVNSHVQRVYEKLSVQSATAAVAKALSERLI